MSKGCREDEFTEEDKLHDSNIRETHEHVVERARAVLDYIFSHDSEKGAVFYPQVPRTC